MGFSLGDLHEHIESFFDMCATPQHKNSLSDKEI